MSVLFIIEKCFQSSMAKKTIDCKMFHAIDCFSLSLRFKIHIFLAFLAQAVKTIRTIQHVDPGAFF